jgi:hypothetical protein
MGYSFASVVNRLAAFGVGLIFVAVILPGSNVGATSNLQAIICRQTPATLTITRPQSDSVVNDHAITLSGSVWQASQLEIYVDDAFSGVESLSSNTTSYTTTVQLSPGTHTIKVVAIDICQVGNGTASIVLTYQPISTPSTGGQVATKVAGAVTGLEPVSASQGTIFQRLVVAPITSLGESLNLVTHDAGNPASNYTNVDRFAIILLGILLIGFSPQLQTAVAAGFTRLWASARVVDEIRTSGRRLVVAVGVVVILGVFIF